MPLSEIDQKVVNKPMTPEHFFEAILARNPFAINRLSDPSQMDSDAPSIHQREFNDLCDRARRSFDERASQGAVLLGGAGVGKSHVLARLCRWAERNKMICIFLHNIQVTPQEMDRYLVKCCLGELVQDRFEDVNETPFYNIVEQAIRAEAQRLHITKLTPEDFDQVSKNMALNLRGDEYIFKILIRFHSDVLKAKHAKDPKKRREYRDRATFGLRWLKGDMLDADEAKTIGVQFKPGVECDRLDDCHVKNILPTIAQLAHVVGYGLIVCLDQVDNMKSEHITALARAWHLLIDARAPIFVVVSGVREDMEALFDSHVIPEASADRVDYKQPIVLLRISRDDARKLIRAKLEQLFDEFQSLPQMARPFVQNDSLFPLGEQWFSKMEPDAIQLRPRDVMTWAGVRWRAIQKEIRDIGGDEWLKNWGTDHVPPLPPEPIPRINQIAEKVRLKVEEGINARKLQPGTLPADADNLRGLTELLLEQCLDKHEVYTFRSVKDHAEGLLVEEDADQRHVLNLVKFLVTGSKTSAAAHLKRLSKASNVTRRILVTDEERAPLSLAATGKGYLAELKKLGDAFLHVKLDMTNYAELDAIAAVTKLARSGDLELESPPDGNPRISEAEVIEAHHAADRYRSHVLLNPLLSESVIVIPLPVCKLAEPRFREFVMARLSFMYCANLKQLLTGFLATPHGSGAEYDNCLLVAKEIAMRMDRENLISVKPWDDDLQLVRR